jgi:hypothetical protein
VRPLAPSRVDACNPLLQAHPIWARDKHEGRGIPPLTPVSLRLPPPSRSVSRRPIWAGARGDNLLVGPGTPGFRNADTYTRYSIRNIHLDDIFPRLHTTRYGTQMYIRALPLIPLIFFLNSDLASC